MTERLTIAAMQRRLGVTPNGIVGSNTLKALNARLTNMAAPAITEAEFQAVADHWGVPVNHIKGVRKVEAPRGAFDEHGRPSILFERHKFSGACDPCGRFDHAYPLISGGAYGPGGYGAFSAQYPKLFEAVALDPEAAFQACSWGAFQVMGGNAVALGYSSAFDMALALTQSEAAHLDSFVRFVECEGIVDLFRACKPGDAKSCAPFVARYNGSGYRSFHYHEKLAAAIM